MTAFRHSELRPASGLDPLYQKSVLILGLARQGVAFARFCASIGAQVTVSDLRRESDLLVEMAALDRFDIRFVLGEHPLHLLDRCDLVSISGSVPYDSSFVRAARERGIPVTNDALEFMRRNPSPERTIGITGSAGKTTTTTLVGEIGRSAGYPTWVGGNIGNPMISDLQKIDSGDLVVLELSSFQLELWDTSPHIAAVLNITPNHLDRHKTMANYSAAKANIIRHQNHFDTAILSADDPGAYLLAKQTLGRVRLFSRMLDETEIEDGAFVHQGKLLIRDGFQERVVLPLTEIQLRGRHNVSNVLAACLLADSAGMPIEAMREAIQTFTGVEHRLEPVRTLNEVHYINDSIATAPERALAALDAFDDPLILLAGGKDKRMIWDTWAKTVASQAKAVILFGALSPLLQEKLAHLGRTDHVYAADDLSSAVHLAHRIGQAGDLVLLSPGGTSYDAYRDFAERGAHFRQLVHSLSEA